jgi:hypothetical protein
VKRSLKFALLSLLFLDHSFQVHAQTTLDTPTLAGVVSNVRQINTANLLRTMSQGSQDLILVAAHRGYWINNPENSTPALKAAFDNGVEVIEIDLRTTSDGVIVISHDADLVKETNGYGFVSSTTWSQIQSLQLRDRKGNPQNLQMLSFAQALNLLGSYQNTSGALQGPVIIADIKDSNSWQTYLNALTVLQATLPQAAWPAVVFKMKMRNISTDAQTGILAQYTQHSAWGHLIAVVNPEDATSPTSTWTPSSSNFQTVFNLSSSSANFFLQQFELNINTVGDGASQYIVSNGGKLNSFATYYESKFYPEGVSTIYGGPNDTRNFNPNPPPANLQPGQTFCCYYSLLPGDLRGLLPFALYYNQTSSPGVSLITTDNLSDTLNLLVSTGKRTVSEIGN